VLHNVHVLLPDFNVRYIWIRFDVEFVLRYLDIWFIVIVDCLLHSCTILDASHGSGRVGSGLSCLGT